MPLAPLLHDLALLALTLAHGADGSLDRAELAAIWAQLVAWVPGENPALVENVLREATLSYANGLNDAQFDALLGRLRDALNEPERARVLADLRALAAADADVHPSEVALVERVEAAWA
ncbi:MAG TPA: TerB family tellurite resistance protein [Rubricoccaceae bacterium]|nr:TerB family tellurite resistance protein [Rubricoccaceae bacterium]